MFIELCQKLFARLASIGAKRQPTPQEWVDNIPPQLEAVVFQGGRAVFLHSPEAPMTDLEILQGLYQPQNEDILNQLKERFRRRLH